MHAQSGVQNQRSWLILGFLVAQKGWFSLFFKSNLASQIQETADGLGCNITQYTYLGITFIFSGVAQWAKSFSNLKRKNFTSFTPLKLALKPFIFELNDSAFALVLLLSKKFRMLSKWYSYLRLLVFRDNTFRFFLWLFWWLYFLALSLSSEK